VVGFFAGWISFFGWIFDFAAIIQITASVAVALYSVYHPDLVIQPWHVYIAYLLILWLCVGIVIFGNRIIPYLQDLGLFLVLGGGLVTIIVVAAMPSQHATNSFVWTDWVNSTGWSDGVAFLAGVLNGAFAIGTPDAITHMAEELPNPKRDLPRAVAAQIILGTISMFAPYFLWPCPWILILSPAGFVYAIAILYGISDLNAVLSSNGSFPLAEVYAQATSNNGATFGLLFIIFCSLMICVIGTVLTISRIWWTLARDNATPFAKFFSIVDERLSCPIPATLFCALFGTALGAIPLGSKTAFQDLVGSFIILSTMSFVLAFLPNILTRRKYIPAGPFTLGRFGMAINIAAVVLICFFNVFYCFREFPVPCLVSFSFETIANLLSSIWLPGNGPLDNELQ
jgi:choline transport protein